MNRYLSTMSGPIRNHGGIIDKYIGDAIMAYWGPPFVEEGGSSAACCLAAIEMTGSVAPCAKSCPNCSDFASLPMSAMCGSGSRPARHWSAASARNS